MSGDFTPGMAIKLFVNEKPSANFQVCYGKLHATKENMLSVASLSMLGTFIADDNNACIHLAI